MNAQLGFFKDLKGSDALLIGVTHESLGDLVDTLEPLTRARKMPVALHMTPFIESHGISLLAQVAESDQGLNMVGPESFTWARSTEGWSQVIAQLRELQGTNCGHQYLDGPHDSCVVIVSIGEYPKSFWHARG